MKNKTVNIHITQFEALDSPESIISQFPMSHRANETVLTGRSLIRDALKAKDSRMVIICGPCSIHDQQSALEYADKLADLNKRVSDQLILVMRVYFEKPRTSIGWKGLVNDPYLDGSNDIQSGIKMAREILLKINEKGIPCATEFLDPVIPQYISDLVSWAAIGARTTESQIHRQMASGLSMPVGFKNSTDGTLDAAFNSLISAYHSHSFVGLDMQGRTSIVRTTGNPDLHIVLRGGGGKSNYSKADIAYTKVRMKDTKNTRNVLIDCSHDNSKKDYRNQPHVFQESFSQYLNGEESILGVMLESHLQEGKQSINASEKLTYGQSITDGCISWKTTESLLLSAAEELRKGHTS